MLPVLDNEGMREADRVTIEEIGIPGIVLMENASIGLVDALCDVFPSSEDVVVLCGRGNNGGDGLAAARHLSERGRRVEVILFGEAAQLSGDARSNLDSFLGNGGAVALLTGDDLGVVEDRLLGPEPPDVVVDALLGTGLDRPLEGRFARVVKMVNQCPAPVVAVDVPTGLGGSSSSVPGPAVEARLTATFGALKICHCLPPACQYCGEVAVVDIGIPGRVLEAGTPVRWVEDHDVAMMLPSRPITGHTGVFGHLLIVGGGAGGGGAVAMAARAAVVSGTGLVTVAAPGPVVPVVDGACLEAMTFRLPAPGSGEIDGPGDLATVFGRMTALAIGPGMGAGRGAGEVLDLALDAWDGPLVLDADALNLLAGRLEILAGRTAPTILTPHPGELARLLGCETGDIVSDRLGAAREAAKRGNAVVVAKGYRTVIADAEGRAWINPTGDHHLGTGGSGDVLTGLIGGLAAQGLEDVRAAIVGCWLHGRAGELGGQTWPAAVPASRLPEHTARAWRELLEEGDR